MPGLRRLRFKNNMTVLFSDTLQVTLFIRSFSKCHFVFSNTLIFIFAAVCEPAANPHLSSKEF